MDLSTYHHDARDSWPNAYLLPEVLRELPPRCRVFDLGCGNGTTAQALAAHGHRVTGIDPSIEGVAIASSRGCGRFEVASAYDDLSRFGRFDAVVCLEVIEHCFWPRSVVRSAFQMLEPGGIAIISTPFHGYIKNLLLALSGRLDSHFTALWDGGHIKFFSESTLRTLLEETGFAPVRFIRAGRIPPIAKSMIAIATRPT